MPPGDDANPIAGIVAAAMRRTQVRRSVEPGTAAQHTATTVTAARPCRPVTRRTRVVLVPAVRYPLPHVPVHVVQTPAVRRKRTRRRRPIPVPAAATLAAIRPVAPEIPAPTVARRRARTRRILPLRLARQPIRLAGLTRQPRHIRLGVLPRHVDHRPAATAPGAVIRLAVARRLHETVVLLERHLVHPQRERTHLHLMHRPFPLLTVPAGHAAHPEPARGDHHQLGARRTVPEHLACSEAGRGRIGGGGSQRIAHRRAWRPS